MGEGTSSFINVLGKLLQSNLCWNSFIHCFMGVMNEHMVVMLDEWYTSVDPHFGLSFLVIFGAYFLPPWEELAASFWSGGPVSEGAQACWDAWPRTPPPCHGGGWE